MSRLAFYDFDGTLASCNVVTQYAFFARHLPRTRAALKLTKLILTAPAWLAIDTCSRRLFNDLFFREYRGMGEHWLRGLSEDLFEKVIRPAIYPGARSLVAADRESGCRTVLVTGSIDVALDPVVRYFRFDEVICNRLHCSNGTATGRLAPPLIAGKEKVAAMRRLSRDLSQSKAYSDSFSDRAMLEAVGQPTAVNPDRRLKRLARRRNWPILDLSQISVNLHPSVVSKL